MSYEQQLGVKIFLHQGGNEFLFLRRSEPFPEDTEQTWDIPGGRREFNKTENRYETIPEVLDREILQETGLKITGTPSIVDAQDIIVPERKLHVVRLTYVGQTAVGRLILSDEHDIAKWTTAENAQKLNIADSIRQILGRVFL